MLHDPTNVLGRGKEFLGYLILGMCAVFITAMYLPFGITVGGSAWFIWAFPFALALGAGYSIFATMLSLCFNLQQLGRLGEMAVGIFTGTFVIGVAGYSGFGLTVDGIGAAITGGIIGTCVVTIMGTINGRLKWYGEPLWFVRKPTIAQELATVTLPVAALPAPTQVPLRLVLPTRDERDNRSFEITLAKPAMLRFEHNGKVVYEQRAVGHIKLMLGDFAPYSGETVVYIDDEPMGYWSVD